MNEDSIRDQIRRNLDTDSLEYWITLLEDDTTNIDVYYWGGDNVEVQIVTPEGYKAALGVGVDFE